MIRYLNNEVTRHANGVPQSDDITMLTVKMSGDAVGFSHDAEKDES